ncbi:glycosyltransferase family 2 protein [Marinobacter sp. CHS3-4]|uniref:glycosyltransferase family 2 protein n=1 Tax=Marinobacter sp. CHS3-4 TaxID=3045174 RepID=UPI0024B54E65|nr:glycosyltransferase family 2 protein [Marinobacter sp. CHS3-4]MDI9244965.1 glycosyltransferase family 2 protein [Marinobacter sp. CHS3-4]
MINEPAVSIIIPAKNEGSVIGKVVSGVRSILPESELIVVDDGSTDNTADVARQLGAHVVSHPYSMGNGAAIKSGVRASSGDILVFMDGDGQHSADDVPRLIEKLEAGYDLVVGARTKGSQASVGRSVANKFYNRLASYMTGQTVEDLTSGFRAARAAKFKEFISLLPNGFSYPTTSTMAFFRAGYAVCYVPIKVEKRVGTSHINIIKDGIRFLLIIFKIGTLYSPLKLFFPLSFLVFFTGLGYYLFTYVTQGRFTNMSALMLTTAILVFLMGLVSEQITQLMYKDSVSTQSPATNKGLNAKSGESGEDTD